MGRNDNTRDNSQNTAVLDENFTYVKGNHVLQFGGRYRHDRTWIFPDQNPTPSQVNFSSLGTGLLDTTTVAGGSYSAIGYTGNTNASFFLGDAQYYQVSQLQSWYHFRQQEIASYFQDDWKVTPKLTLNLGIRWEIHPALHEAQNLFGGYDFKNSAIVTGPSLSTLYAQGRTTPAIVSNYTAVGAKFESASDAGLPSSMVYGNYHDIAPRFGFAYQLFPGKHLTVLRGGYGIYVYPPPTRNFYAETRQNPPYSATFTQSYTAAAQAPDGLPNYMLRSAQTIIAGQNSSNVVNLNSPSGRDTGLLRRLGPRLPLSLNLRSPVELYDRTQPAAELRCACHLSWHPRPKPGAILGVRRLSLQLCLVLQHRPSSGHRCQRCGAESPYPNLPYGYIENQRKTGYSNDNSIQVQWERLHKNGYGFQIFYTLSNDFRNGGNGWRDSSVEPASYYLNGAAPADLNAQNRWANYRRDLNIPQHEIRWNWLVDLP